MRASPIMNEGKPDDVEPFVIEAETERCADEAGEGGPCYPCDQHRLKVGNSSNEPADALARARLTIRVGASEPLRGTFPARPQPRDEHPMRFRYLSTTVALAACIASPRLGAQEVASLLDKYATAFGGNAKIQAMKTQHMTGRISFGKSGGSLIIDRSAPNKSRMDMVLNSQHLARGFDGSRAWQAVEGEGGRVDVLNGSDVRNMAIESDFYGPLIDSKAPATTCSSPAAR